MSEEKEVMEPTEETPEASVDAPGNPTWAEVMKAYYKQCNDIVSFLSSQVIPGGVGVFQGFTDMKFIVGEFKTPNMAAPEYVGVLFVLGLEQIKNVRAVLLGEAERLPDPEIKVN